MRQVTKYYSRCRYRCQRYICYVWYISCLLPMLLAGCTLDNELEVCPYNVRFSYQVCDGRGFATSDYPLRQIRQFVNDAQGVLVGEFPGQSCETGVGTLNLPPGDYTLVAWGNTADSLCALHGIVPKESRMEEGTIGACHYQNSTNTREAMNTREEAGDEPEYRNTDLMYYGRIPFSVSAYGLAEYEVGMMHAHARLNLTIEWKDEVPEALMRADSPVMRISGVGTGYGFAGGETWGDYLFPNPHPPTEKGTYRSDVTIDVQYKVRASFVTFRLRDEDHPVVTLTHRDEVLMKEVDLHRYFAVMGIGLTRNLRQEFDLTIRIEHDRTVIMETDVSGWEDGGDVGTNF